MDGIFVTATCTEVGKTTISAGLLRLMHGHRKVAYWKPIQTGTVIGDDTNDVKELTEFGKEYFLDPVYRLPETLAPYLAARAFGKKIDL